MQKSQPNTTTEQPQHEARTKKPYEAPKLIVMGSAVDMTQGGLGLLDDGLINAS